MPLEPRPTPGPLVAPAPALGAEQRARAQRQIVLPGFGEEAQRRLRAARVLVVGAGGLGSASVPYLVGAGIGTIGIIDDDRVELSNLHRQVSHTTADIGRLKVESLADTARALDPGVTVVPHAERLTAATALSVLGEYDLVIDGSDNFPTRYLVADATELLAMPLVWGSLLQFHGQAGVSWRPEWPGFRDLFPAPPAPEDVVDCGSGGVLPALCGTIGSTLATEAMKLITGIGEPLLGRVLVVDALAGRTREIAYSADPGADPVTGLIDYERFCAGPDPAPPEVSADTLAAMWASGEAPRLLDVRTHEERDRLRVIGAESVPLDDLERDSVAFDGPVIVHCERDPRSVRAAKLLIARGVHDVRFLRGGIQALVAVAPEHLEGTARDTL